MEVKEMLKQAVSLQDQLNTKIDSNWKENRSIHDFKVAITQEVAELIDSFPWKWWKKMEDKHFNKQIELVDIFHFMLSELILVTENVSFDASTYLIDKYERSEYDSFKDENDLILILHFLHQEIGNHHEPAFVPFFNLVRRYFKSLEEFLDLYFVKNILNEIRQMKGYKSGTYKKTINGKEDNEIIFELIKDKNFESFEELRNYVIEKYSKIYEDNKQ